MAQTYTGIMECILVDDCGTDKSMAVAEQLIADYHGNIRFRMLPHTHNRGLAAARNTAVEAATGDFIVHVDSDDWIEPNMIESLVAKQQETGADIVSCNAVAHFETQDLLWEEPVYPSKDEMMHSVIQMTLDHVIWRRLIRTSLYKNNNISAVEGINIGEDHYTLPRLLFYAESFAKCDEVLYHYNCVNAESYMQQNRQKPLNDPKYRSDRDSINILIEFFAQHDTSYLGDLYTIQRKLVYDNLYCAIQTNNKDACRMLHVDWMTMKSNQQRHLSVISDIQSSLLYYIMVMRILLIIQVKKLIRKQDVTP